MVVDLLSSPNLPSYDLSSLRQIGGGGAAMPEAVAQKLQDRCGLGFIEGYGLTETMAPTHINPPPRPKKQCLGIPLFHTDSRRGRPDHAGRAAARRGRRDRVARTAGVRRLLEQSPGQRRVLRRDRRPAVSSGPATSAAPTRTATSSWSIGSSG